MVLSEFELLVDEYKNLKIKFPEGSKLPKLCNNIYDFSAYNLIYLFVSLKHWLKEDDWQKIKQKILEI